MSWEGQLPPGTPLEKGARKAGFIPYPCKAGDLVLIHGQVDHMSLPNWSSKSRHTYQLHLIEGPSQGIKWSESNWLQLKKTKDGKTRPFPKLDSGVKSSSPVKKETAPKRTKKVISKKSTSKKTITKKGKGK